MCFVDRSPINAPRSDTLFGTVRASSGLQLAEQPEKTTGGRRKIENLMPSVSPRAGMMSAGNQHIQNTWNISIYSSSSADFSRDDARLTLPYKCKIYQGKTVLQSRHTKSYYSTFLGGGVKDNIR